MARVEVYFEDAENGAHVRWRFVDGFNAESPAHQLAQIMQSKLDDMAAAGELTALPAAQGDLFDADATTPNRALVEVSK